MLKHPTVPIFNYRQVMTTQQYSFLRLKTHRTINNWCWRGGRNVSASWLVQPRRWTWSHRFSLIITLYISLLTWTIWLYMLFAVKSACLRVKSHLMLAKPHFCWNVTILANRRQHCPKLPSPEMLAFKIAASNLALRRGRCWAPTNCRDAAAKAALRWKRLAWSLGLMG